MRTHSDVADNEFALNTGLNPIVKLAVGRESNQ